MELLSGMRGTTRSDQSILFRISKPYIGWNRRQNHGLFAAREVSEGNRSRCNESLLVSESHGDDARRPVCGRRYLS